MTQFVMANFVNTTLAAPLASGSTSMTLASSSGLPTLSAGQIMPLTINDAATGLIFEIVYVTAIAGAVLTVEHAQEGTSAQNWNIGDIVFCSFTAGTGAVTSIVTQIQGDTYSTAADAGAANAYVGVYTPAITAYTSGMTVALQAIANSNTGASTFNAGAGVLPIKAAGGQALQGGELIATFSAVLKMNSALTYWELVYTSGGATPVVTPTQSHHAVNKGYADTNYGAANLFSTNNDETGSRAFGGGPYTNSTGKPMFLNISITQGSTPNQTDTLTIAGVAIETSGFFSTGQKFNMQGMVPAGATYSIATTGNDTISKWIETY